MAEVHEMKLPDHIAEVLSTLVSVAEQYKVSTMYFRKTLGMTHYNIALGANSEKVAEIPVGNEDPLSVLEAMKLITILQRNEQSRGSVTGQLYVTLNALAWVKFKRSGGVKKWSARSSLAVTKAPNNIKETAEFIGAVGGAIVLVYALLHWLKLVP